MEGLIENMRLLNFKLQKPNPSTIPQGIVECYTNRVMVLQIHTAALRMNMMKLGSETTPTFTGYHDHTASTPVALGNKRNLVGIKDLMGNVNQVMKGKFFLCRTITPSSRSVNEVEMVVEDPEGKKAVILALYNYSGKGTYPGGTDFEGVVPKGGFLVVKNPWFTHTVDGGVGGVILRCDSPGNVEMMSEKEVEDKFPDCKWRPIPHEEIPSYFWGQMTWALYSDEDRMKKLKDLGNRAWVEKRFTDAIRWYKMGLDYAKQPGVRFTILNNMTAALTGMECWNAALKSVEEALQIEGKNEKALHRKGKCLMGLEKWKEAIKFLEDLEGSEALKKLLDEARELEKISKNPDLLKRHWFGIRNSIPIASYKGPVTIANIPGKGRGLIATEPLVPGQLVLVAKAFVSVAKPVCPHTPNLDTAKPYYDDMVFYISNKIALDPELGKEFYSLEAGKGLGYLKEDDSKNGLVDLKRIHEILAPNAFQSFGMARLNYKVETEAPTFRCVGGITILSSMINHSCSEANCLQNAVGNGEFMMLKAMKNIKEGEELTFSYVEARVPYEDRKKTLQNSHGFTCTCQLCLLDASDPKSVHDQRSKLVHICKTLTSPNHVLATMEELINLRKSQPELNLSLLIEPVDCAVEDVLFKHRLEDCVRILKKMIIVLERNPCMIYQGYEEYRMLLDCYIKLKDKKGAKNCLKKMKEMIITYDGGWRVEEVRNDPKNKDLKSTLNRVFNIDFFKDKELSAFL